MDGYTEGIKLAREKLGVRDVPDGFEFIDWVPPKPRYMHNVTYRRILERFTKHQERYTAEMTNELTRIIAKVSKTKR